MRVSGRLRFTELEQLDAEAIDTDEHGPWCVVTLIKLHRRPQQISIDAVPEESLDPVRHLLEVRRRVKERKKKMRNAGTGRGFCMGENEEKMSYKQIRNSVINVMRAAGISNPKPHQLKAAATMELKKRGTSEPDIVQYTRHVHGSRTWAKPGTQITVATARVS
jgi:hypothetical protein